jgi:polar amino acid transport system substrate-binding protein
MNQQRGSLLLSAVATLALNLLAAPAPAQQAPDPRVADLVQAGRLRFGLPGNTLLAAKDPVTGELRGVAVDLARELAARIGVAAQPVEYPNAAKLMEGLQAGAWDVGFLGIDPERAKVVDFTPPYMELDLTYLVPAGSPLRSVADADRCGVRIGVTRGTIPDLFLSRTFRSAEIVRADTDAAALDLLRAGKVDAIAENRIALLGLAVQLTGSRVLEDRFLTVQQAIAVPKGLTGRLAFVSEFIERAKASGFVQQAIERHSLRGVQVAPPAALSPEQEVRALFGRFLLAQNGHNLAAVGEQVLDSPRFLWITGGTAVFGREAALKRFEAVFQGTWHLEPKIDELQVTLLREDVAQLYVPLAFTTGPAGQAGQTSQFLMNQMLVKTEKGWQIASILPIPAP